MNLDDTTNCPRAEFCEGCGSHLHLRVVTVETAVGVYCVTFCLADQVRPGKTSAVIAVVRSLEHCGHLGIDADQMAELMASEPVE